MSSIFTANVPAEEAKDPAQVSGDMRELGLAVRIVSAAVVVAASAPNLFFGLFLPKFEQVFMDLMQGKRLPALTIWIFAAESVIPVVVLGLPACAIMASCLVKRPAAATAINGALTVVSVLMALALFAGIFMQLVNVLITSPE